nr:septation protein IspZ [Candidatus Sarmatiella mevalonica]
MLKLLSELVPLVVFFVCYHYEGIQNAAIYMFIASLVVVCVVYIIERKVPTFSIISTVVLLLSALLSIATGNTMFIKMKPTVLYLLFGSAFYLSAFRKKPFLQFMLKEVADLSLKAWVTLSYRFAWFFIAMALLNEVMWRSCEEGTWVKFKVFGAIPITLLFTFSQIPFLLKHRTDHKG